MPRHALITLTVAAALAAVAACSSSAPRSAPPPAGTPTSAGPSAVANSAATSGGTAPGGSTGPAPVESNPPGDIPDNQAYVVYTGAGYTLKYPEGWTRAVVAGTVRFSDKYTSITVESRPVAVAPTTASARAELPQLSATHDRFVLGAVSTVRRPAGAGVLVTYRARSPINPVTGKVVDQEVERYEFWRGGHEVVVTLAAPVGSDNVDPWRIVTDSLTWTGR